MYKRIMSETISRRLKEKRRFIQVIVGPRQAGKTTAIQQILDEIDVPFHYAAADLPAPPDTQWVSRQWDLARLKTEKPAAAILVLDEIQKVAHWSNEVKRLWDEDHRLGNNIHVVLLGSSSLLIQKGLSESLAGRFELIRFPHWSWEEMRDCFGWSLEQYVFFGGYPAAATLIDDENLIKGLSKWSGNVLRLRNSSPKWLPFNTGLLTALSNRPCREWRNDSVAWGRLVEVAVGAHLVNCSAFEGMEVYYWREGNHEADFVLRKGNSVTAIEVKSGQGRVETRGLTAFKKRYPRAKTLVVGLSGISLREFFETPLARLV